MDITTERITPALARKYLASNTSNRALRKHRVARYANEMSRDQWLMTGDPIKFDTDGVLADGQHRLAAVIEYGKPVTMVVVRGIPADSFKVLDSGLNRQPADALGFDVKNAVQKSSAARLMFVVDCGGDPRDSNDMNAVTRSDVSEYYATNADALDSRVNPALMMYRMGGNKTAWLAFMALADRVNPVLVDEFCEAVRTGANLSPGDPRLALRNFMANGRRAGRENKSGNWLAVIIKAWNAWMAGQTRQAMRIETREDFPTLTHRRKHVKEAS